MDMALKRLLDIAKEAQVPIGDVARALDVSVANINHWTSFGVPVVYELRVETLTGILENLIREKKLPASPAALRWFGLVYLSEERGNHDEGADGA